MKTFRQFFEEANYDIYSIKQGDNNPVEIGNVPDKGLQSIQRIVKTTSNEQIITKILSKKIYSEESFKPGHYERLVNLIGNIDTEYLKVLGSNKLPKLADNKVGQLSSIGEKLKIPWEVLEPIHKFEATDAGGSAVGKGEILFALLFKDVTNSTSGGDLMWGSNKLEVKGVRARLGQQEGRGGHGIDEQDFINIPNHNTNWQQQILDASRAGRTGTTYNVASLLSNAVNASNDKKGVVRHFQNILTKLYPKSNISSLLPNEKAIQDPEIAKKTLFKINTDHYINLHEIQEILAFDPTSKYIVMNKEEAFKHIDNDKFKPAGNILMHNWAPNIKVVL